MTGLTLSASGWGCSIMPSIKPMHLMRAFLTMLCATEEDDIAAVNAYTAGAFARQDEQPRTLPSAHASCAWAFYEGWDGVDRLCLDAAA